MTLARPTLLCLAALATAAGAAERPVRIAFPDVVALDDGAKEPAGLVNAVVAGELVRGGRKVVGAAELDASPGATAALRRCPDAACLAAAAELGADYVLLASAAQLGSQFALELKLIDPAKGTVLGEWADVALQTSQVGSTAQAGVARLVKDLPMTVTMTDAPLVMVPDVPEQTAPPVTVVKAGPSRLPAYVTLGGGAAAMVVGGVLVGTALSFNQNKTTLTYTDAVDAQARARTRLVAGYVLLGAGVTAAGAGVYLLLKPEAPPVAVVPITGGAFVSVSGAF